jgi:GNAT superfamily N-acetyltransferase
MNYTFCVLTPKGLLLSNLSGKLCISITSQSLLSLDLSVHSPEESWERRRLRYQRLLNQSGSFVLIAEQAEQAVGYALVAVYEEGSDTWQTPDQVAKLETLSVLPEARGAGIGSALVHAVYKELCQAGITEITVKGCEILVLPYLPRRTYY